MNRSPLNGRKRAAANRSGAAKSKDPIACQRDESATIACDCARRHPARERARGRACHDPNRRHCHRARMDGYRRRYIFVSTALRIDQIDLKKLAFYRFPPSRPQRRRFSVFHRTEAPQGTREAAGPGAGRARPNPTRPASSRPTIMPSRQFGDSILNSCLRSCRGVRGRRTSPDAVSKLSTRSEISILSPNC